MKAWFVFPARFPELGGYGLHAATRGKACAEAHRQGWWMGTGWDEFQDITAHRLPGMDKLPVTHENMLAAGIDMTYEGEPITEPFDIVCGCPICKGMPA